MRMRTLIALAVAAGFSATAYAGGDKTSGASSGASSSGAEKMFQALDKNKDGSVSREEAKGTPHDKDFAQLDKNNDGKLSRQEHAAAPEHAGEKAATGGTGSTNKY
jgi:EF hand